MLRSLSRPEYKYKVLVSVIFGLFMVILDTTVINVAFPTLRRELGAELAQAQWVISLYVLVLGIATPLAGWLADRFGIKRVYLSGLAVFAFGSLLCGVAPTLSLLVAARGIQGLGGGVAIPLGTALLLRAFPREEQGRALGIFGIVIVFAPAVGPILGGWLVDMQHWRWIFFINLPIAAGGLLLGWSWLRAERNVEKPAFDGWGLLTEVIGFGATLYAASLAERLGWTAPATLLWFAVGLAGLAAFAWVELRVAEYPLLDLRLFGERTFLLGALVGYVVVLALFGAEFLLPVYLQSLRGETALGTGLILLPLAVAAGVVTPLAGWAYDRIGPRPLVTVGFAVLAVNTWYFAQLGADTAIDWIVFLMALRGVALGMTVQTSLVTALSTVSGAALPRGSSLINATRRVAQAIGVALLATVLAASVSPASRRLQTEIARAPAAVAEAGLCEAASGGGSASSAAATPATGRAGLRRACKENLRGFERAYLLTFYLSLLAVLLGLLLPGWPFAWEGRRTPEPVPA